MAKVLFLIAQDNFRDEELKEPRAVLKTAGADVVIASETTNIAEGMFATQVKPDMSFSEAFRRAKEFDAVIVIGGSGSVSLLNNTYALRLVKKADEMNKIVAAICWGPRVLAKAGVLDGRKATVNCSGADSDVAKELKHAGAKYVDKKVVTDGRLITAFGPKYATDFGEAIRKKLGL